MNIAEQMGYKVPTTFAEQARGKIAFLTRLRASHLRFAQDKSLKPKDRAFQAELAAKCEKSIATLTEKLEQQSQCAS